jgi:hypothetical protein
VFGGVFINIYLPSFTAAVDRNSAKREIQYDKILRGSQKFGALSLAESLFPIGLLLLGGSHKEGKSMV